MLFDLQIGAYLFDLSAGLVLVAIQEEIVFRRCAGEIIGAYFGEGPAMIILSALLFGNRWAK